MFLLKKLLRLFKCLNDDKSMQLIDLIKTYAYTMSKDLKSEKEEIKSDNIRNNTKMIYFDDIIKENITEHNPNWLQVSDHQRRILIIGGSGSGRTNSLFTLIGQQPDIDKMCLQLTIHVKQNINF